MGGWSRAKEEVRREARGGEESDRVLLNGVGIKWEFPAIAIEDRGWWRRVKVKDKWDLKFGNEQLVVRSELPSIVALERLTEAPSRYGLRRPRDFKGVLAFSSVNVCKRRRIISFRPKNRRKKNLIKLFNISILFL